MNNPIIKTGNNLHIKASEISAIIFVVGLFIL